MKSQITLEQALSNLYRAARMAPLTAQDHEVILESAKVLQDSFPKPKVEKETVKSPKQP